MTTKRKYRVHSAVAAVMIFHSVQELSSIFRLTMLILFTALSQYSWQKIPPLYTLTSSRLYLLCYSNLVAFSSTEDPTWHETLYTTIYIASIRFTYRFLASSIVTVFSGFPMLLLGITPHCFNPHLLLPSNLNCPQASMSIWRVMMDCFDPDWCCRIAQQTGIQVDTPKLGVAPESRRSSPSSQKHALHPAFAAS